MARQCQLVLVGTADLPVRGGARSMLAHRQAGARLGILRGFRYDLSWPQAFQRPEAAADGSGPTGCQQGSPQVVVQGEGGVTGGVGATGDPAVDLPERGLVGDQGGGRQARSEGGRV